MAKSLKKANKTASAVAVSTEKVELSVYPVLDTLDHDGDRYIAGEEIELDPASSIVAQLQALNVIGAAIAIAIIDSPKTETDPPPPPV